MIQIVLMCLTPKQGKGEAVKSRDKLKYVVWKSWRREVLVKLWRLALCRWICR